MSEDLIDEIRRRDEAATPTTKWRWGVDYGQDLLADINAVAHARGTSVLTRDCLKRAYSEIARLRRTAEQN